MSDDKLKDSLMEMMESDETAKELADTKAAQDKLAADETALEADPKVRVALALAKVKALVDEVAPLFEALPEPVGAAAVEVKSIVDFAVDEFGK